MGNESKGEGNVGQAGEAMPMEVGPQRRSIDNATSHVRLLRSGADVKGLVGYGAVFYDGTPETEYEMWEGFKERIMPGAFDRAIKEGDDVRGLFNHDPNQVLGRTSAKTMRLEVDKKGLIYEIDADDTQVATDVQKFIDRGDVTGSSFSFDLTDETWLTEDEVKIREIRGVKLYDTGPVTFPAYPGTTTQARSEQAAVQRSYDEWVVREADAAKVRSDLGKEDRDKVLAGIEELMTENERGK